MSLSSWVLLPTEVVIYFDYPWKLSQRFNVWMLQNFTEISRAMQKIWKISRILQNLAESCKVLQSLAESCRTLQNLIESCRILQSLAETCRILQKLAESCRILQIGNHCIMRGWIYACIWVQNANAYLRAKNSILKQNFQSWPRDLLDNQTLNLCQDTWFRAQNLIHI